MKIISYLVILIYPLLLVLPLMAGEEDIHIILNHAISREKEVKELLNMLRCELHSRVEVKSVRGNEQFTAVEVYVLQIDSGKIKQSDLMESKREGNPGERQGPFLTTDTHNQLSVSLASEVITNLMNAKKYEIFPSIKNAIIDDIECYVFDYTAQYEEQSRGDVNGTIWIDKNDYSVRKHEMEFRVSVVVASASGKMKQKYTKNLNGIPLLTNSSMEMDFRRFLRRGSFNLNIDNYNFHKTENEKTDN